MAKTQQLAAVAMALVLVVGAAGYGIVRGALSGADGFQQFTSATKGYSIDYPTGWVVERDKPVLGTGDPLTTDDFVSPDKKATVDVECVPIRHPLTIDDFLENRINVLKLVKFSDPRVEDGRLMVAGTQAPVITYSFTTEGKTTYFSTALIVKECGWSITISASTDTKTYRELFERIARSFQPE